MAGEPRAAITEALTRAEAALQLSAGVAHDVRNALQVVLGCSDLLSIDPLSARQAESVRDMQQAASHAMGVLGDFVSMARRPAQGTSVVEPAVLLERLRPMVRHVARSAVEWNLAVEPGVWPVSVDAHQLESVLLNLCANARDAMPDGGRLRLSARNVAGAASPVTGLDARDRVEFAVHDTGIGMSGDVLARATEAFFTTKADRGGNGLGLAMAQEFAVRSGGTLRIDSTEGVGTTVALRLPRAVPRSTADPAFAHRRDGLVEAIRQQLRTPWLRLVMEKWLQACGDAALPSPVDVDAAVAAHDSVSLAVLVEPAAPSHLRLLRLGVALQEALTASIKGDGDLARALAGSLGDAYRLAAVSRLPTYERVRYSFGAPPPAEFERMVMPASVDGDRVSHLIGVVLFAGVAPG